MKTGVSGSKTKSATCCSCIVNIARYLKIDSESALKRANRKFKSDFSYMEGELAKQGKTWSRRRSTKWKRSGRRQSAKSETHFRHEHPSA